MSSYPMNAFTAERNTVVSNMTMDYGDIAARRASEDPAVGGTADMQILAMADPFQFVIGRKASDPELGYHVETDGSHALGFVTINRTGKAGDSEAAWWARHRWIGICKGKIRGGDGSRADGRNQAGMIIRGLTNAIHHGEKDLHPYRFLRLRIPLDKSVADRIAGAVHDFSAPEPAGAIYPYLENVDPEKLGFSTKWMRGMRREYEAEHVPSQHVSGHSDLWNDANAETLDRMITGAKRQTFGVLAQVLANLRDADLSGAKGGLQGSNAQIFEFVLRVVGASMALPDVQTNGIAYAAEVQRETNMAVVRGLCPATEDFGALGPEWSTTLKACRDGTRMLARMLARMRYQNLQSVVGFGITYTPGNSGAPVDVILEHYL